MFCFCFSCFCFSFSETLATVQPMGRQPICNRKQIWLVDSICGFQLLPFLAYCLGRQRVGCTREVFLPIKEQRMGNCASLLVLKNCVWVFLMSAEWYGTLGSLPEESPGEIAFWSYILDRVCSVFPIAMAPIIVMHSKKFEDKSRKLSTEVQKNNGCEKSEHRAMQFWERGWKIMNKNR